MGSASTPPPPQNNPGKDLQKYVSGLESVMPSLLNIEGSTRPQFGAMNLADIAGSILGTGTQQGLIGLGGQATQGAQQQLEAARAAELGGATGQAGLARGLLGAISPGSQSLVDSQTRMAQDAYGRAGGLSAQESRLADQTAREAFGARGRLGDTASVAGELLSREDVMAKKRAEASALGQSAFGMEQAYSSPALSLLTGSPTSTLLGQDYLNAGRGSVGQNVPQLIDTGAGISLGQQNSANMANWQSNVSAAKNAQSSQNAQIGASVATAALSALAAFSDEDLKENKKKVGKTKGGHDIYTYNYKGHPKTHMGVMAQEVEKKKPGAVHLLGGARAVDYAALS